MQLTAFDIEAGHPPQTVERALRRVVAGARRDGTADHDREHDESVLTRRMLLLSTSLVQTRRNPFRKSERRIRLALGDGRRAAG